MEHQVIEAQPESDADAAYAFQRMGSQLALLNAAVEGFAARQTRIEQRDYSEDLAKLAERQRQVIGAIKILADRPGMQLTPDGIADDISRAAVTLRSPDQAALASAQAALGDARVALVGVVAAARTKLAQRDALIWAVIITMGVTALLLALAPLLTNALWPTASEGHAVVALHKSRWEAGIELMASGDPARWRQLVDANRFQQDTAATVATCRSRANSAAHPVRCSIDIAPTERASRSLSRR